MSSDQGGPERWIAVVGAALLLTCGACATNVVLRRAPASDTGPLGPFQRCEPLDAPCAPDPIYDSSRLNASNTQFFQLPSCTYGIHDIMVERAGSDDAVVLVRCAAPTPDANTADGNVGLPTTAAGGGTVP